MAIDLLAVAAVVLLGFIAWRDFRQDQFMAVCCGAIALLLLISLGARHLTVPLDERPEPAAVSQPKR